MSHTNFGEQRGGSDLIIENRFIVNRLLVPYMRKSHWPVSPHGASSTDLLVEAIRMVERGDATPEDIDQAMELGAGYRESSLILSNEVDILNAMRSS